MTLYKQEHKWSQAEQAANESPSYATFIKNKRGA